MLLITVSARDLKAGDVTIYGTRILEAPVIEDGKAVARVLYDDEHHGEREWPADTTMTWCVRRWRLTHRAGGRVIAVPG